MQGGNKPRRNVTTKAKAVGKSASEEGATEGASKQRVKAKRKLTPQQRMDLERESKR
jgi:hypothetical protein